MRKLVLQMCEHLPEQRFHHVGVAAFVRPAHGEELRAVVAQGVAQTVQPDASGVVVRH